MRTRVISEPPLNPKAHRETLTQHMFEIFCVQRLYLAVTSVLSLYGTGRTTGIVVESGHGVTHIVPVYQGCVIPHAIIRSELSGALLTNYMIKILNEKGYDFATSAEREIVRDIKEKLAYVAINFEEEMTKMANSASFNATYELPSGHTIVVGNARFQCAEAMFQPSLLGLEEAGIHEKVYTSVMGCEPSLQSTLFGNIVLSGGNTMFVGLAERLAEELRELTSVVVKVIASPERKYIAWIGGSMLSVAEGFQSGFITKDEFDELGSSCVHQKRF